MLKKIILLNLLLLSLVFSCDKEKKNKMLQKRTSNNKVEIGDSLFISKVFISQQTIIEKYRTSKDTTQLRADIDFLFKEYYAAWNDCFSYPKEYLYKLHLEYANSSSSIVEDRTKLLLNNNIDLITKNLISKVNEVSRYNPSGNHYLLFMLDNNEFNMGGCDKDLMYINLYNKNFSIERLKRVFPHELNHQIYEETLSDANSDLILWGIIDEGFASYFERLVTSCTIAEAITITQNEYEWCLANEKKIFENTLPILYSTKKEDELLLRDKGALLKFSPGQLNYFLGFRIIEKYVEKYGKDSWRDVYTTPVKELFIKSEYQQFVEQLKL